MKHRSGSVFFTVIAVSLLACGGTTDTTGTGGTTTSSTSSGGGGAGTTTSTTTASGGTGGMTTTTTTTASGGSGGQGTGGGVPCQWNKVDPCPSGSYCDAFGCGQGTCQPLGKVEQPVRMPVCGCDGVTYWNPSIAASHGAAIQNNSACSPAKTCGGFASLPCPTGATCNYHLANKSECGIADASGECWAIPQECPQIVVGATTHACQSISCTDECNLIKLMTPWYDDPSCPQ